MHERSIFPLLRLFLSFEMSFQHHDRDLTKFHAGSEQPLVFVVIINFIYPTVKNNNTAYHAFGKYWMQARGFLNHRLKYCLPTVIYCSLHVCQINCTCLPNELKRDIKKKTGGGASRGPSKNKGGTMAHPVPPLESPLTLLSSFQRNN